MAYNLIRTNLVVLQNWFTHLQHMSASQEFRTHWLSDNQGCTWWKRKLHPSLWNSKNPVPTSSCLCLRQICCGLQHRMCNWDGHRDVGDLRGRSLAQPDSPLQVVQGHWDSGPLNTIKNEHKNVNRLTKNTFTYNLCWYDVLLLMEVFGHNICLIKCQMVLTFTGWKGVPVPAPFCSTRDRDTHSVAVVRHPELIPKLCASMAEQRLSQEVIYLLNLNLIIEIGAVPAVSFHIWPLRQIN